MDYNKLYLLTQEKLFTDLILTLCDNINHNITINVNKNVLYASCIYFEKLLTNCKEKNLNNITINVHNVYVAYDIIMTFYGQKTNSGNLAENKHLLETIKCYNFFGKSFFSKEKEDLANTPQNEGFQKQRFGNLVFDESLLDDIEIPEEDFELLLDVIDIVGYNNRTIRLINKNLPKDYDLLKFPNELLNQMLVLTQTYNIVSASSDKSIKIWNGQTGKLLNTLVGHTCRINCICNSPNGELIASGSDDRTVNIWNSTIGEFIKALHADAGILSICCSTDNELIAIGNNNYDIEVWNIETSKRIHTLKGHTLYGASVCFSPDNKQLISGSYDNTINIWDVNTGKLINTLCEHQKIVSSVCYSTDNKKIISSSYDGTIKIWDAINGTIIKTLNREYTPIILSIGCSKCGKSIVSAHYDGSIRIWDIEVDKSLKTFMAHSDKINSICYSPDDAYIISGSQDRTVKIWDSVTGDLVHTLSSHTLYVNSVCCVPTDNNELINRIKKLIKN